MNSHRQKIPQLAIIVPSYNEELVVALCAEKVQEMLSVLTQENLISEDSYCLFVDDGSADSTWEKILDENKKSPKKIKGLKLTRNFGHQYALLAGLESAQNRCDCAISIDADLQHDLSVIVGMLKKYHQGSEVVLAVKNDRNDSAIKRITATGFYKLSNALGTKVIPHHADFRLLGAPALKALLEFKEVNLFIRGLIPELGFRQALLYYDVKERAAGVSKYSFYKMFSLALRGITSFSMVPLRLVTLVGSLVLLGSMCISMSIIWDYMHGHTVPGWTSTVLPIYFLGGVQMLSIGILGEYLGKTFLEVKRRPRYLIEDEI